MKDSKKYSDKLLKLFRSLKREYGKVDKPKYDSSTDALVYAIVSENIADSAAQTAVKKLGRHFVDWNELRVSRPEEILEILGKDNPENRRIADALTQSLYAIFNKYDMVSLDTLREMGKRQAKAMIEKLLPSSRFVVNYVMLTAMDGHAIPLTPRMLEYLKNNDLVHPEADVEDIEGFLERQITAQQAYDFYTVLRRQSESAAAKQANNSAKTKADDKNAANK
jgi:endonuclease III